MKIQSINKMQDFGVFSNFINSGAKSFSTNNILFGWNYSGKTTLSRVFRSLEIKRKPEGFENGKFTLTLEDNSKITHENIETCPLNLRVFNADYIKDNLKWEQPANGINPILIVGEENVKLQDDINLLNKEKAELGDRISQLSRNLSEKKISLNGSLTDKARQMTVDYSLNRLFDRTKLEELLNNKEIQNWKLAEDDLRKYVEASVSSNKLDIIPKVELSFDPEIVEKTAILLKKAVTPSRTMQNLKDDPNLENWVREGRKLHKDKKICGFCGNYLKDGFLSELDEHFSKEYEAFRKEVSDFAETLKLCKMQIELKKTNEFYTDLQSSFLIAQSALQAEISKYNEQIELLLKEAIRKFIYLPVSLTINNEITINTQSLYEKLKSFNFVISENNAKTAAFDKIRQEAIEYLKEHAASVFFASINYSEKRREIESLKVKIEANRKSVSQKENEIYEIERKISESVKGCEALNNYIRKYFGGDTPIEIKIIKNRFHIYRGDKEATNLSEGEKTAISFSYFLARLNDKDTKDKLKETLIYVDDPISSLDNNHLYNTFSLIAALLKDQCAQLFISTHNFEFFNLLKDLIKPPNVNKCSYKNRHNDKCDINIYLVDRSISGSVLKNIDCLLCHFKSEYHFLFYQLYEMYQDPTKLDDFKLYAAPNMLRRFLETFTSFIFPSDKNLFLGLKKLLINPEDHRFVMKVINEMSHNENIERSLKLCTMEEIKDALNRTFSAFEKNQKDYFVELKCSVGFTAAVA